MNISPLLEQIINFQTTRIVGCQGMTNDQLREEIKACMRIIAREAIKEKTNAA